MVCLNSYLPQLAKGDKDVKEAYDQLRLAHGRDGSLPTDDAEEERFDDARPEERTLLALPPSEDSFIDPDGAKSASETYAKLVSGATSRISSKGIAIGYSAGIALLILLLIPVTLLKGSTFALRLSISLTGLWWMVFTMPAALWLPGSSSLNANHEAYVRGSLSREIKQAWAQLGRMLLPSEIAKLRNTFWFLLAWFLLSDGVLPSLYTSLNKLNPQFCTATRFHHHNIHCHLIRQNLIAYGAYITHAHRCYIAGGWNSWRYTLAHCSEEARHVQSPCSCGACVPYQRHSRIWLLGILAYISRRPVNC